MRSELWGLGILVLVATGFSAQEADGNKLALETERVVVFKDGYALFVKKGHAVADGSGQVETDQVPESVVLGTYWATGEPERLKAVRAGRRPVSEERDCGTMADLLKVNAGKRVVLALPNEKALTGTLLQVLDAGKPTAQTGYVEGYPYPGGTASRDTPVLMVVVDTPEGKRAVVPVSDVRSVSGEGLTTRIMQTDETSSRTKHLVFDFGKEAAGKQMNVHICYFTQGVRWIPTYRLTGPLDTKGNLALQAELLNEAEDIVNVPMDLVVGVPNFRFKKTISPLSLEKAMRETLAAAAPALSNQFAQQQVIFSNGAASNGSEASAGTLVTDTAPDLAADGRQDLFVYSVKDVELKKGERAALPLWDLEVPLSHVYTMEVHPVRNAPGSNYNSRPEPQPDGGLARPARLKTDSVWHQVELSNVTTYPWTTGAALVMQELLPVSQDMLTYTPIKGKSLLPLTVAVDIEGKHVEEEISRQPNSLTINGSTYAEVKTRGKVTVTNYRKEPATCRITVGLAGKIESPSDGGKVTATGYRPEDFSNNGGPELNGHSDVAWELTLAPGETKAVEYSSRYYSRN